MSLFSDTEAEIILAAFKEFADLRAKNPGISALAALISLDVALTQHGVTITRVDPATLGSSPEPAGPRAKVEASEESWFPYAYRVQLRYRFDHPGVTEWRVIASEKGRAWNHGRQQARIEELMAEYRERARFDGFADDTASQPILAPRPVPERPHFAQCLVCDPQRVLVGQWFTAIEDADAWIAAHRRGSGHDSYTTDPTDPARTD